jgi:hypothetical protein
MVSTPAAFGAPTQSAQYHVVLPKRALGAGERVDLRLVPPPPPGVRLFWSVQDGAKVVVLQPYAVYTAPFVIPKGTPPARVTAGLTGPGVKTTVTEEVKLEPGSVPGAEDCLGPGQSYSTATGVFDGGTVTIDGSVGLVHSVEPDYPRPEAVRGVVDTITVIALVCRTGRVLDAYVPTSYADRELTQPIGQDPKIIEAALQAVRQYEFRPATSGGIPVATLVVTPVHFTR